MRIRLPLRKFHCKGQLFLERSLVLPGVPYNGNTTKGVVSQGVTVVEPLKLTVLDSIGWSWSTKADIQYVSSLVVEHLNRLSACDHT